MRHVTLSGLMLFLITALLAGQGSSALIRAARDQGGSATSQILGFQPVLPLKDVIAQSSLILRGRLTKITSHLTDDREAVFTELVITPVEILKPAPTAPNSPASRKPAQIAVRRLGGVVHIDGLLLRTVTDTEDLETPMEVGNEYVMYLQESSPRPSLSVTVPSGVYEPTNGDFSIYRIENGQLAAFNKLTAHRRPVPTESLSEFLALMRSLAARSDR